MKESCTTSATSEEEIPITKKEGILNSRNVCWKIFSALNSLELKSLEEPIYLFGQFFKKPVECSTLG
ncbi:hypothetical protein Tco_0825478 [Tanacetum coccineum]